MTCINPGFVMIAAEAAYDVGPMPMYLVTSAQQPREGFQEGMLKIKYD